MYRHRPIACHARVFMRLLCALMLVIQPVSAAVGEWHELAHDPSGGHTSLLTDASQAVAGPDSRTFGVAGVLHVLIEGAHGCGPGAAMAPLLRIVAGIRPTGRWASGRTRRMVQTFLPAPFKPPIAA